MKLFSSRFYQQAILKVASATVVLLALCSKLAAQAPASWTVNPAAFQYSMTLNGVANIYCVESTDPQDKVAAFVGGQCRGVANFSQVLNGRYLAFLIVRSNQAGGETVTFQIYDASTNTVENVVDNVVFQDAATYGFTQSPYELRTNTRPVAASGIAFSIPENAALATTPVANALVSVTDADLDVLTLQFGTTPASNDNAYFTISGNGLQLAQALDFETRPTLTLALRALDARGCAVDFPVTINVTDINDAPTDIVASDLLIDENAIPTTQVCTLDAVDPETTDVHTFTLVAGTGSADNSLFSIAGNSLLTLQTFNYETRSSYNIRVRTTDQTGNSFEKAFVVSVTDLNDAPTNLAINGNSFAETVSENQPIGAIVGTLATTDEDVADVFAYTFVGSNNSNSLFQISNGQLRTAAIFDYETTNVYVIEIQTQDLAGVTLNRQFVINVVNANDAPTVLALNNNTIVENQPVGTLVGGFATTDVDAGSSFTYTLVSGAGSNDNALFDITGNSLVTNASFDFETRNTYSVRVRTTDNGGAILEQSFTISVLNTNDAPTNLSCSDTLVAENAGSLAVVCNLSTTDADAGDAHTYTLVPGFGDNNLFGITGSVLNALQSFDFETRSSYSILVQTIDAAGASFQRSFTIRVTDANDTPTAMALSNQTVAENLPLGTVVGTFSTTDQDATDSHSYTFIGTNNSNSLFQISNGQLRTAAILDYETTNVYIIEVQTRDQGGATYNTQFVINVADANDTPTNIVLVNNSLSENQPVGTSVGSFSTNDPDVAATFTYSLVPGVGANDNASFRINNDVLESNIAFDYETRNVYSVRVRSTDNNGGTREQAFTIVVNNANDAPTALIVPDTLISENDGFNALIGSLFVADQDANDRHTYSLVAGFGDNNLFNISGSVLRANQSFNFEARTSYNLRVRVTDQSGASFVGSFAVQVINQNDAPTSIAMSNQSILENQPFGTVVGTFSTTDEDQGDTHTYSFVSGNNSNTLFQINGNELRASASFNFEAVGSYILDVQTTDALGATFNRQFVISVLDANDAPTVLALNNNSVLENRPTGTLVGGFATTDVDAVSSFTYSLVSGAGDNDNALFGITGNSLLTNAIFDFETRNTYSVRVRTTDNGGASIEQSFAISIQNANDAPTNLSCSDTLVAENAGPLAVVCNLSTADVDAMDTYTYTLVAGFGDNSRFGISGSVLQAVQSFDFEVRSTYSILVQTTDASGASFQRAFTIRVTDENDAPTAISMSNQSVVENRPLGTVIGTFASTDQDAGDTHTYSFVNGNNSNAQFQINGNELRTNATFDFETVSTYVVDVMTTDVAGTSFSRQFIINIVDANDAPTALSLNGNHIVENQPINTFIGTLATTDADAASTFGYALVAGVGSADNASFRVSGDTLYSNATFDFETRSAYSIRVRTTDNGGLSIERAFGIVVNDGNDAPVGLACTDTLVAENAGPQALVCNLSTTDVDPNDTHTYSLVAGFGNNNLFGINGSRLVTNQSFNFEGTNTYTVSIQTTDNAGASFQRTFTIRVTDENDAPTDLALGNLTILENQPLGALVGAFTSTDEDAAQNHSYALVGSAPGNAAFQINANELRTNRSFDFETNNVYVVEVQTTDAGGLSYAKQFIVNILDANDAPTAIQITDTFIVENQPVGTFIGAFTSSDVDASNTFSYALVNGVGASGNGSFFIRNDSLFSNVAFDFETQDIYSIRVRTTDNAGGSYQQVFRIRINNGNDAPTGLALSNVFLDENVVPSTLVGMFTPTDVDNNGPFTFDLVAGTGDADNAKFFIINNELKTNAAINYEVSTTLSVRIQVTDAAGGVFAKAFTILVNNQNDQPTALTLSNNSVDENRPTNTLIGALNTTDEDAGQGHVYTFANGANNSNSMFLLVGNELRTNASYNFEVQNFYIVYVLSTDAGGATIQQQFVVNILNTNDAPEALFLTGDNVDENLPVGAFVGVLSATDQDVADTKTYALVPGANASGNGFFTVRNDSLFTNSVFDFEQQASYNIRVRITDGLGATFVNTFVVNVNNKNDAPTQINIVNNRVPENSPAGTVAGLLSTNDADANSSFSYTLVAGTGDADNASFSIVGDRLFINVLADYETRTTYAVRVRSTDNGGVSIESAFAVDILDANERPSLTTDTIYITENVNLGTVVGTFRASDPDAGDALSFSFVSDAYDALLDVQANGDIVTRGGIDYEQANLQNAVIINGLPYNGFVRNAVVTDGDGLKDTTQLIFVVRDVVEDELKANNVVTPNGDGVNDAWELDNPELYKDYEISFYGPNGELMKFVSGDYDNTYTGGELALQMTVLMRHRTTGHKFTQLVTIIRE